MTGEPLSPLFCYYQGIVFRENLALVATFFYVIIAVKFNLKTSQFSTTVLLLEAGLADPHRFSAIPDPDPAFHFDADPDPDPALHQSDGNLRPLVSRSSIVSLQASIVSVSTQTCFEPLKLLKFDFNTDLDPAFHSNIDPDPVS